MKLPVKYKDNHYISTETFFVGKQEYVVINGNPIAVDDLDFLCEEEYFECFMRKEGYFYDSGMYRNLTEDCDSIVIYYLSGKFHAKLLSDYNSIVLDSDKISKFQKALEHCETLNNIKCENK